jgi:hypothetical protein
MMPEPVASSGFGLLPDDPSNIASGMMRSSTGVWPLIVRICQDGSSHVSIWQDSCRRAHQKPDVGYWEKQIKCGVVLSLCCACAGSEPEYKSMQVLCLVAAVDDDPQCPVAAQVSL